MAKMGYPARVLRRLWCGSVGGPRVLAEARGVLGVGREGWEFGAVVENFFADAQTAARVAAPDMP